MGRRGHGEGTIVQLKDGRWQARLSLPNGKRKAYYGKTKREAREKLEEAKHALAQGCLIGKRSQKVGEFLDRWLEEHTRLHVKPKTYESYALNVKRVRPYIGHQRLDALTPDHLQHCYAELLKRGLSKRSVQQAHAVLRIAFRHAARTGLIVRIPTQAATPPRSEQREIQPLTPEQVRTLIKESAGNHLHALWVLLVTTGLRIGEATGLTWDDVNLTEGTLAVRHAMQRQRGRGMVMVEPKTSRSRRLVHLAPNMVEILREHRRQQSEYRLPTGDSLVFSTLDGKPFDPGYLRQALHRVLDSAGLPRVRLHDLRHTAATYLLSMKIQPKVVQDLLGHSSITQTIDTYSHVIPALHMQVADQMDALFEVRQSVS